MRLLILTQYFPPETGAPQNRLFQLARRLNRSGFETEVLTAMPNYPKMKIFEGYRGCFYRKEVMEGLTVHRSWIYTGSSRSILPRLMNYFSFVFTALWVGIFRVKKPDLLFCESPPLFLGITAWLLARPRGVRLIFNVSDLWPESAEKLGLIRNRFLLGAASRLEEFLYRQSWLISGQTQGIVADIRRRFPEKEVYWLRNGVDVEEIARVPADPDWREREGFHREDFLLIYAGIIGHAQGLETILHAARLLSQRRQVKFILMGSGPVLPELLELKRKMKLEQVFFLSNRPRNQVIQAIMSCDAAIIPLKNLELFRGAIPSKIFENLALRKPVLLGVDGEAKTLIIDEGEAGLFFTPENENDLALRILWLTQHPEECSRLGNNGYDLVCERFNVATIMEGFKDTINKKLGEATDS